MSAALGPDRSDAETSCDILGIVPVLTSSLLSRERRLPQTGEIVHLRQRLYLVDDVVHSASDGTTVVRGSCVDDDAQGQKIEALWELEPDAEIRTAESWDKLADRGFDPPDRFAAYLNTMRWNCVTSTDARLLQSPFRAGIKLEPYQLEPLRKALRLPSVNLFIADNVGLGKTIEAGLIARELLLRKKVSSAVRPRCCCNGKKNCRIVSVCALRFSTRSTSRMCDGSAASR